MNRRKFIKTGTAAASLFAVNGAYIILSVLLLIGILLLFDLFLHNIFQKSRDQLIDFKKALANMNNNIKSFFGNLSLNKLIC